jgi:hypothetical protein
MTLPMIDVVSVDQAANFSILRRARVADDQLPAGFVGFGGGRMGQLGLNPALSRRATTGLGDVWVVPGNGWLALQGGGGTANPTESVAHRGMIMWTASQAGNGVVHGLMPDGVSEVALSDWTEASFTVQVIENVFGASLDGYFRSLSFVGPQGQVELGPY